MGPRAEDALRCGGRHKGGLAAAGCGVCPSSGRSEENAPTGLDLVKTPPRKRPACVTCLVQLALPRPCLLRCPPERASPVEPRALYSTFVYSTIVLLASLSTPLL